MKRTRMMVIMILVLCAGAQAVAFANVSPNFEEYRVTKDGMLFYQGDIAVDCRSLLQAVEERNEVVERAVEVCTNAGFPPEGSEAMLPESGGLPRLTVAAAILSGAGILGFIGIHRRRA